MAIHRYKVIQRLATIIPVQDGASAIEFALLAPILTMALLGTVDVGRALAEQITMGSLLRTGAQSAISGGDASTVGQVVNASKADASMLVDVTRICSCPESTQIHVACSATCAGLAPTSIYYSLHASKRFSGMLLPSLSLSRSLQVQVR